MITKHPSSFRDPSGFIFTYHDTLYRCITEHGLKDFEKVWRSQFLQGLMDKKKIVLTSRKSPEEFSNQDIHCAALLQHEKIPCVSYPYEWCFQALQDAALLQLDIHLEALKQDITLKDASAYNIQFIGTAPIFIDLLSFSPYRSGDIWWGHRQFCEQFLYPLLLSNYVGIPFQEIYRGYLRGIPLEFMYKALKWSQKFYLPILMHVVLPFKLQHSKKARKISPVNLPKSSFIRMLIHMRKWIDALKLSHKKSTAFSEYTKMEHYSDAATQAKKAIVKEFCQTIQPKVLLDLGCNTGVYSELALQNGAKSVIGFDSDPFAINNAYIYGKSKQLNFLPLYIDFSNPSAAMGWMNQEHMPLIQRVNSDGLLALAFIHHLRITHNIPLAEIVDYILTLAPRGLIEFVPKTDEKVQSMLSLRKDVFYDYTYENFETCLKKKATIKKIVSLPDLSRIIFWYEKR